MKNPTIIGGRQQHGRKTKVFVFAWGDGRISLETSPPGAVLTEREANDLCAAMHAALTWNAPNPDKET